jgi:pyrophosphatase PpaX
MQLRGMIFDMDGTLCDTVPAAVAAFRLVFERYLGRCYSDEEIVGMFGPSEEGMIRQLIPDQAGPALADFLAEYDRLHEGRRLLFPGLERALELLRAHGIRLGIVTGKGPASAAITLRRAGLDGASIPPRPGARPYFDVVEAGSPVRGIKQQSLRAVLDRWRMPPGEAAYVGDSPSDMRDAIAVGVMPLGAGWAATSSVQDPACCGAEVTFDSVERFVEWIERET